MRAKGMGIAVVFALGAGPALARDPIPEPKGITLRVGGSAVLGGLAGRCGHLPARDRMKVSVTQTGHTLWGRVGVSRKKACGGVTPAVEVIFVADRIGRETLTFAGRKIAVLVTP